jgi:hypothetical protein
VAGLYLRVLDIPLDHCFPAHIVASLSDLGRDGVRDRSIDRVASLGTYYCTRLLVPAAPYHMPLPPPAPPAHHSIPSPAAHHQPPAGLDSVDAGSLCPAPHAFSPSFPIVSHPTPRTLRVTIHTAPSPPQLARAAPHHHAAAHCCTTGSSLLLTWHDTPSISA